MVQAIKLQSSLKTNQGRVRQKNDDSVGSWLPKNPTDAKNHGWIFLVADGVGGLAGGNVASNIAITQFINHYLNSTVSLPISERIEQSVAQAHQDIITKATESENNQHMATTLVGLIVRDNQATFVNVGDSRGYLWHNQQLKQITQDQSLVAELVKQGAISPEEAENHPHKNIITSSLGSIRQNPSIDIFEHPLEPGDRILLCSDGLTNHLKDEQLRELLTLPTPEDIVNQGINDANLAGGTDNISVAVIDYEINGSRSHVVIPPAKDLLVVEKRYRRFVRWLTFFLSIVEIVLISGAWWLFNQ